MEQFIRTCGYCAAEFETDYPTKEYCSRKHKERAKYYRKLKTAGRANNVYFNICPGCSAAYSTRRKDQKYCSTACGQWHREQIKAERDREYRNKMTPSFRRRVFFNSNGICGICKEGIDLREKHPSKKSFSIDHIVPRSKGGSHSFSNLQAAHLGCNERRGDKALSL